MSETMQARRQRPLSPHLSIYRPQITSVLSIAHRITGVVLALGLVPFALWLWAAAYAPETYAAWQTCLLCSWSLVGMLGWSFCLYYHLCNGIRHLFWDIGWGYELRSVTNSGIFTVLCAIGLTVATWYCAAT